MHGINFDLPLKDWFDFKIPKTTIHPDYIHDCLLEEEDFKFKGNSKILFIAKNPICENFIKTKKGNSYELTNLTFHLNTNIIKIELEIEKAKWLMKIINENSLQNSNKLTLQQMKVDFEEQFADFELFWFSKPMQVLKENGVVLGL
jgi:hypothetical protein